jgi:PTH2 family peptidyl-tRNA hydrolase
MIEDPTFYIQMKEGINCGNNQSKTDILTGDTVDKFKMVILVRDDIKMGRGKIGAQVGHAVLGAYKKAILEQPELVKLWEEYSGSAKIVLQVNSENQLIELRDKAKENNLNYYLIRDAGRTQVDPGTITCCAIGPGRISDIDSVTGKLSLL